MRSIESVLQNSEDVVWVFRGVYGKRIKSYGVAVGFANRKLRTFMFPSEAASERALDQLRRAIPHASVGWDSDAYVQLRFRKPERLRGRTIDVDDYDTGFRGFLLWRVLKPLLIPAVPIVVGLWVLTRPFILFRLLSLFQTPGSDEFLQTLMMIPGKDEITFVALFHRRQVVFGDRGQKIAHEKVARAPDPTLR